MLLHFIFVCFFPSQAIATGHQSIGWNDFFFSWTRVENKRGKDREKREREREMRA